MTKLPGLGQYPEQVLLQPGIGMWGHFPLKVEQGQNCLVSANLKRLVTGTRILNFNPNRKPQSFSVVETDDFMT